MLILITERPSSNGYVESLIKAYQKQGHEVICNASNFFYSNKCPDLIHIQWPESLYKWHDYIGVDDVDYEILIENRLKWFKSNGACIVHSIHNIVPHDDKSALDKKIFKIIITYSDILVHHCKTSIQLLIEKYPPT